MQILDNIFISVPACNKMVACNKIRSLCHCINLYNASFIEKGHKKTLVKLMVCLAMQPIDSNTDQSRHQSVAHTLSLAIRTILRKSDGVSTNIYSLSSLFMSFM